MIISTLFKRIPKSGGYMMPLRSFYKEGKHKIYTMDDLPVPKGIWKCEYNNNQKYYNLVLGVGIASFVSVVAFGQASGCMYYRFNPPASYD